MPAAGPCRRYCSNDTGTGNTLTHGAADGDPQPALLATKMHVDGCRFDLATILGREDHGFGEGGGFLDSCRHDPALSSDKLISEPSDCGPSC